jgi:hypothetical protein
MGRFLALLLVFPAAGFAAEIPSGTHVLLRMVNSLNTRTAKEGDQVYMQTATPVALNGAIVIPVGSYVQGTVSLARRGGRVSGRAELALHLDTLTLPGGKALRFAPRVAAADPGETSQKVDGAENTIRQGSNVGQDAARIAVLAGTGASVGGLTDQSWKGAGIGAAAGGAVGFATTLMTRGREVELRAGSTLDVVFDRALDVE